MSDQVFAFGPFELYPGRRLLLEVGKPLHLGSRAFDILVVLVRRAGEVVGKDELIARVWPDTFVEEANLRVHVAALRKALGDGRPGRRFLANVPGRGYCFVAPATTSAREPGLAASDPRPPGRTRNLPAPLTRVVGRADDVRALAAQLPRRRLVTVVGPGGIGKTTVALAAAEEVVAAYSDGAAFIDLAPIADPASVPGALASALGLAGRAQDAAALAASLRDKAVLVVLDGCEPVIRAASALAEALLRAVPGVGVLATSTEPLRVEGEWVHRLPPLGLPPASDALTAAEALRFPAVQLFVERAAAILGGFGLKDAEAPAVAEICRRLDGIAFAIELAAGRADAFGPRELAALLDDRFRVLTRGRRTALPRHQTLRAALEWSHGLLPGPERVVLRRLSVFNGGFGFGLAAAAEVVSGGEVAGPEVSDLLASLFDKSLVAAEAGDPEVRYRLLDTTRAYARERLEEAGEADAYARRHAECYKRLFERAEAEWDTRPTAEWLAVYARHLDNLRAALDWAFSPGGDPAVGVALAAAAAPIWFQLSLVDEGFRRTERALAALDAEPDRDERRSMRLHAALGALGRYAGAGLAGNTATWKTVLGLAERVGDVDHQLRALWALWTNQNHEGYRESLALARRFCDVVADAPDPADRLVGERMLGHSLHLLGDQAGAREQIEHVLGHYVAPVRRSHAVRFHVDQRIMARNTLARVLWLQGFPDQALREVEGNVEDALSLGHALPLCNALALGACPVALLAHDLAASGRFAALLRRRTAEHALDIWTAYADCYEGELLVQRGDPGAGLTLLEPAVDELRRLGYGEYLTAFLGALAQGLVATGRVDEAIGAVEEALARSERTGERWCLAELWRLRGEVLLERGAPDAALAAEAAFQEALRTAREQGALSWELRSATSLAGLWRGQRRDREARALLAPVHARFTEGFGRADLLRAAALLEGPEHAPDP